MANITEATGRSLGAKGGCGATAWGSTGPALDRFCLEAKVFEAGYRHGTAHGAHARHTSEPQNSHLSRYSLPGVDLLSIFWSFRLEIPTFLALPLAFFLGLGSCAAGADSPCAEEQCFQGPKVPLSPPQSVKAQAYVPRHCHRAWVTTIASRMASTLERSRWLGCDVDPPLHWSRKHHPQLP